MTTTLTLIVKNFRSIKDAQLELGVFTILTGENNSGKSSFLYALQVMRNVVSNPNQTLNEFLNLHFLNLGGLDEVMYYGSKEKHFTLGIEIDHFLGGSEYKIYFSNVTNKFIIKNSGKSITKLNGEIEFSFPFPLNKYVRIEIIDLLGKHQVDWNGIGIPESQRSVVSVTASELIEQPILFLSSVDITPTQRGFSKPIYNLIPLQQFINTEDEVATLLATDKTLQARVSYYFEKITGKRFTVSMQPKAGFFYLQVREPDSDFSTELVNQGMGINQIVYLLAKILYEKNRLICVDEPEIHLHPTLIEKFMHVLVEIAQRENKRFLFSTHNEHLLLSLLAEVHEGNLKPEDLKVHYLTKEDFETKVETQKVDSNGQIEGGLKNFIESQMQLSQRFFPIGISE